jgi:hypothetical protein
MFAGRQLLEGARQQLPPARGFGGAARLIFWHKAVGLSFKLQHFQLRVNMIAGRHEHGGSFK